MTPSKSLADQLSLPIEGYDPELLLATMIRKYASLPALYEDPEYFYEETDYWWRIHKNEYAKMFSVMAAEYNPLENYDRNEERHIQSNDSKTTNDTSSNTVNGSTSGSSTNNVSTNSENNNNGTNTTVVDSTVETDGSSSAETKVSAFNEDTYQPSQKIDETNGSTTDTDSTTTVTDISKNTITGSTSNTSSDTGKYNTTTTGQNNGTELGNSDTTEISHLHGNIGVTRSQEMLMDELKVRTKSVYGIIASRFADDMLYGLW